MAQVRQGVRTTLRKESSVKTGVGGSCVDLGAGMSGLQSRESDVRASGKLWLAADEIAGHWPGG
jgi:hypothetical protein